MADTQEQQYQQMMLTPVSRLIPKLAWPTMLSMMTAAVYNTADTWFVSRLGDSATGATGVCLPVVAMIQAVGFWIGMGAGSNISRFLGQRKNREADVVASSASLSAIIAGLILTALGIFFNRGIMESLGSTPTILPYAKEYSRIIFIGAPFSCLSFVFNNLLRSQGKSFFAMIGIVSGAVLNIFLDPIFIFTMDMGISGAALSTVLCQVISSGVMLYALLGKNSMLRLGKEYISKQLSTYTLILTTGLPSLFRQGCSAAATILLNRAGGVYGDAAVAAMSVVGRVNWLVGSLVAGFGQGFQPVCGFAYGAGNYARVRKSYFFSLGVCTAILITGAVSCWIFAEEILSMFKAESHLVVEIGSTALRFLCLSMPFSALVILANMLLQTTGERFLASITSISRQGMFFIPLILILPHFFGITGVEVCQAVSDILSAVLCSIITMRFFRTLSSTEKTSQSNQQ